MSKNARQRVRLGPWPGGLNLRDHPQDLRDDELSVMLNVDIDDQGILRPKPAYIYQGISMVMGAPSETYPTGWPGNNDAPQYPPTQVIEADGYFYATSYHTTGFTNYIHVKSSAEVSLKDNWVRTVVPTAWGGGGANGYADFVYKGRLYLVHMKQINSVPTRKLQQGTVVGGDWTLINGPKFAAPPANWDVQQVLVIKDRLFLSQKNYDAVAPATFPVNRVYWSKSLDFATWAAPDGGFVDVGNSDSNASIKRLFMHNNDLIIVKNDGIWRLSWNIDPATDGVLEQLSTSSGYYDGISYHGRLFFLSPFALYEWVGGYMVSLSSRVVRPEKSFHTQAGDRPYITSFDTLGDNFYIGGSTFVGVKDKLVFGSVLYGEWWKYRYNGTYYVNLVYDLTHDRWMAWKSGRKYSDPGAAWSKPIASNEEQGTVIIGGQDQGKTIGGLYEFAIGSKSYVGTADIDTNKDQGPAYFVVETKSYSMGDPFKWKQFHRFMGWIRNLVAQNTGNLDFNIRQLTYDNDAATNERTEDYTVALTQPYTTNGLEGAGVYGLLPFTRKRFKLIRYRVEGQQVNSSNTGNNWTLWQIPNLEMDVDIKRDVHERKP